MGGMAAAARLAVKGHDVTIVEQGEEVGGKLRTYRRDHFAFASLIESSHSTTSAGGTIAIPRAAPAAPSGEANTLRHGPGRLC